MSVIPSSIWCLCEKSNFLTVGKEHCFITWNTHWMQHAEKLYGFEPLILKIEHIMIKAFFFKEGTGLMIPDLEELIEKARIFNLNPTNLVTISSFIKASAITKSDLFLNKPLKIYSLQSSSYNLLTKDSCCALEITPEVSLPKTLSISDPFEAQIKCLSDHTQSLKDYQTRFSEGSYKLIDAPLIETIKTLFFKNIDLLKEFDGSTRKILERSLSEKIDMISVKKRSIHLYFILKEHQFKGAFKTVMPILEVTDTLKPVGISISNFCHTIDELKEKKEILQEEIIAIKQQFALGKKTAWNAREKIKLATDAIYSIDNTIDITEQQIALAQKEISFRKHPHISHVLTKLFCYWELPNHISMIHSWACFGTLDHFFNQKPELPLAAIDDIILQMLYGLNTLHTNQVVHKDLDMNNFVIDKIGDHYTVYINDVGSSCFKTEKLELEIVSTNGYNLAPELLIKCISREGLLWAHSFILALTFEDWLLSERFQIASLITRVLLGKTPFEFHLNKEEIQKSFPGILVNDKDPLSDPSCYLLDRYLETADSTQLSNLYYEAYRSYFLAIPKNIATDFSSFTDKEYQNYIDSFWKLFDSPSRIDLNPYLYANKEEIQKIYQTAKQSLNLQYSNAFYKELNRLIASNTTPIKDLIPSCDPKIQARLEAIYPLFDLDPSKRPPLKTIYDALKDAIKAHP